MGPQYRLLSIFPEHEHEISIAFTSQDNTVNTGILNVNKYSDFDPLLRGVVPKQNQEL